jgi:uncharacterized protein (DUF302 family)
MGFPARPWIEADFLAGRIARREKSAVHLKQRGGNMSQLAIQREVPGSPDSLSPKVEEALKQAGFGVLTRIDFDQKIQEKLGEKIPRTIILGACNPKLAYEAFRQTTDVALLIPCNVVLRESAPGKVMVEAMRPSQMLELLPAVKKDPAIEAAETKLKAAIEAL